MPQTKKYLSKINKGGVTIYMKDEEARAAIEELDPASHASTSTCEDIISELT